ncbi:sensor histidine kinase [Cecembia rubra]|uniref:sensor histidine kinase n=1 Tax=Cecembia rubra TaxID=1485585 RepID=UPI002714EB43|nr:HAMP domain-containing sensor histidine kinase [Cecembia rubra]
MNLPYKIRLSIYLTTASAMLVLMAFLLIYGVANWTLIRNMDNDLERETAVHQDQISLIDGEIRFLHKDEWEEREHQETQFHPIFIEIVDSNGKQLDKSPNLGNLRLGFIKDQSESKIGFNQILGNQELRTMQIALRQGNKVEGFLLVAKSFEESRTLLNNLKTILFLLFPLILISLFLTMRFLAGKSIKPVQSITQKAHLISQNNLNERIPLPQNHDEIYSLTEAINDLLNRLENAMKREQQFTSDASHELRTPLSVIKGNFEVLIRKPREQEEYINRIKAGLEEINKLNSIIDQLLALARSQKGALDIHEIDLGSMVQDLIDSILNNEGRHVHFLNKSEMPVYVKSNEKSLFIILTNLIQNALKYSKEDSEISVTIWKENNKSLLEIKDQGIGIEKEALSNIFNPFFRENAAELGKVPGSGLGLSIVKKLCDQLGIYISIVSEKGHGTAVRLIFPE